MMAGMVWGMQANGGIIATGGTVSDIVVSGVTYRVHAFTNVGADTFEVVSGVGIAECLVVGGGGGGGNSSNSGGGGGGGGVVYQTGYSLVLGQSFTVVVGSGGAAASVNTQKGSNGGNSSLGSLVALGGGGGGSRQSSVGANGGSGGGGAGYDGSHTPAWQLGGTGLQSTYGDGHYGRNGGRGRRTSNYQNGGGGGGAGQAGIDGTDTTYGQGGNGLSFDMTGISTFYAGGGGGGGARAGSVPGSGGLGGGGGGSSRNGSPHTGGGGAGGGSDSGSAGSGGSGIVIVRYELITPKVSGRVTDSRTGEGVDGVTVAFSDGGGSVTTAGGGYYTNAVGEGWSGTVVPEHVWYGSFSPTGRAYANVQMAISSQNYTWSFSTEPPVAMSISDAAIGYSSFTGIVKGVNFQPDATRIRIDTTELEEVVVIDGATLTAVIPAGFPAGAHDVYVSNDGEAWQPAPGLFVVCEEVTLNGTYSGLLDYPGKRVIIGDVTVGPYTGEEGSGSLEIRARSIYVVGTVTAKGKGYGGGGGGGAGGSGGGSGALRGGNTGDANPDGIASTGEYGGNGGGYGGGGGGGGGDGCSSGTCNHYGGTGTAGGGDGGWGGQSYGKEPGSGGGGSGGGCTAGNGANGGPPGGAGCNGGGAGGSSYDRDDAGGGGGGGGGAFGGAGGVGSNGGNGGNGSRGGYQGAGINGDSSTDLSVAMGSGGGGGGGGQWSSAAGGSGGLYRGGRAGAGGAAGGGRIILKADTTLDIQGTVDASGSGQANVGAGYGAGGGILLKASDVHLDGTVRTLGGYSDGTGTTVNGGTIKLFYRDAFTGTLPTAAGRVYTATFSDPVISGCVTNPFTGMGVDGVAIALSGNAGSTATTNGGYYTVAAPLDWSGTLTAYHSLGDLSPASRGYTNLLQPHTNQNFSFVQRMAISGRIVDGQTGAPLVGCPIQITGYPEVVTGAGGVYTAGVAQAWSGTITPTPESGVVQPASRSYVGLSGDLANQDYTWTPPPSVTSVSPDSGIISGGTTVFIEGTNFSASPLPAVTMGGANALNVTRIDATTLRVVTPARAEGYADVTVTNPDGQSATLTAGFRYLLPPPQVFSIEPMTGPATGGGLVTVYGSDFGETPSVWFGATPVTVLSNTTESLWVSLAAHASGWVDVTVSNPDSLSTTCSNAFFYLPVIQGRVTNSVTGAGVEGVEVTLSGGAGTALTAADGSYNLMVSHGWSGTATVSLAPALGAGNFAPASRSYSNVTNTQAGQDYSFVPENPTIAGRVINDDTGEGIEGAVVTFSGGAGSVATDAGGYYEKTVPYLWTGTATPGHTNAYGAGVFTPGTRDYTNLTASLAGQDFSWKPPYVPGNRYVSLTGVNEHPYTNWVTAARDIQTAVNAAGPGDTIYVADGTYNVTWVITVDKPVTIVSENGPSEVTVRRASGNTGVFNLTVTNAVLDGFTIRDGYVSTSSGAGGSAGGVGLNHGALIRNCVVESNRWYISNGGAGMTMRNGSRAINCVIRGNDGNRTYNAGGVYIESQSRLVNCTVYGNWKKAGSITSGSSVGCGGIWQPSAGTVYIDNCIVWSNTYGFTGYGGKSCSGNLFSLGTMVVRRTCYQNATGASLQDGSFCLDPGFMGAGADLRLAEASLCMNYGDNAYNELATDVLGNARVSGGQIDLGAYEFVNSRPRVIGQVTHEDTGGVMGGVTVGFSDGGGSVTTAGNGYYVGIVESGWNGTATPVYGSGSFTNPAARTYGIVTADQRGQNYIWTPPDPVVSGRVTHQRTGAGIDGVTMSFDGLPNTVTSDGGQYSFTAPRHASGTLTPQSAEGGGFSPATRSYADMRSNLVAQNFIWVPPTRAISGRVVNHYTGAGVEGATVSFSADGGASVTTDAGGYYTGQVYYGWTGRATPAKTGGTFTPTAYREYVGVTAALTGQDYVWRPNAPVISGQVTNSITRAGVVGVTVTFSDGGGSTVTTNGGYYTHVLSYGWSGTAAASYALGVLVPVSRTYEDLTENAGTQNYSWTPPERTVAGRVTDGDTGAGLDGLTVGFSQGGGSAATAGGGYYTRTLYYGWAGTATVAKAGGVMIPSERGYGSGLLTSQTGQDYVWRTNRWISGMVTNVDTGGGVDGIVVGFTGGPGSVTTSNGGQYRMVVTYNWSGTATPSGGGATFTPSARSFSGVTSDRSGENFAYKMPRTISGRVTNHYTGAGVDGLVVDFGGAGQATTVYGGYYSRTVPDGWSGAAVPQGVGVYQPASRAYTAIAADVSGQDYEWTPPDPVVSGRVAHRYTGAGIGGLTVTFSGGAGSATTAGNGTFSRTVDYGWSGTVSVSCETGSMLPASRMLGNVTSNQTGQNFEWDPPTVPISGVVTNADTGLGEEGVVIGFSDGLGSATTGADGSYTQRVYVGWSGTSTPVRAEGTFAPSRRIYTDVTNAQAGQNYAWYAIRTIEGRVLMEDTDEGLAGVTIQYSGGAEPVTTDEDGYYILEVNQGWSGTVTPQAGGQAWMFEPATRSYSGVAADLADQEFRVRQQRRIAGRVTDLYSGAGVNGVMLTNVTSRGWTSTAGGGNYELWVRNGWSGRIEARHASGSFVVVGRDYTGVAEDIADQNYVWIPPNPVISGRVTNLYSGAGVAGVAVTFFDGVVVTSAVNGAFSRSVPRGWSGMLTPSFGSETFQPSSRTLTNVLADTGGQDFGWLANRIAVFGRVTNAITGVGVAGVALMASGGTGSTATAADGSYSLSVDYGWSGTVQPSFSGGTFTPGSRSYTSVTTEQEAQDFGWEPPVSGGDRYVSPTGASVYPFTNWATAATNLQWAINAANAGESVWVANGTYGVALPVTVGKAIWVRSVDGAPSTVLERSGAFSGELLHVNHANAKVSGFTLQGGDPDAGGDGADVQSGYLYNAIVRGHGDTGLVLGNVPTARIANCLVVDNAGAGIAGNGVVVNCTVAGNGGSLTASLVYNTIADTSIVADEVRFSLAPGLAGQSNQSGDPMFIDAAGGNYHLRMGSPAIDRGNNFYNTLSEDLEGTPRILNAIDLGVYETKGTEGLSVALMAEPSPVIGGDAMQYVVWAFNSGPGAATGVEVEVGVPAAMSYLGHTDGMSYQSAGALWTIGNLSPGAHRVMRIEAQTGAAGWVTNVARISAISADPSTPGYDVATNVLEVLGPVQITNVLAGSSSGNATVQWNSVVGQGYDVYVVSGTPTRGAAVTFEKQETGLVVTDNLRDYLDDSLGEGEVQRYYQVSYEDRSPETNSFWGVIRKDIAPGFTMLSPAVRTDRRFDGELGEMLAESLTGSASADGDKVFIMTEGAGWRMLWLDADKLWREQDGQRSACMLPEGQGLYVLRANPSSTRVTFRGPVGNDGTRSTALQPGFNLIGLSEGWKLPLKATLAGANPHGGAWEEEADQLVIQRPDGSWQFLMFVTNWGAPYDGNWFDLGAGEVVAPGVTLEPGQAYYYLRRGEETNVEF